MESKLSRGLLLALGRDAAKGVFSSRDDEQLRSALSQVIADAEQNDCVDCQAQWTTLHRMLTDGSIEPDAGELPLNQCVLGGRAMHQGAEMTVVVVRPDMVPHVAEALEQLSGAELERRLNHAKSVSDDARLHEANAELMVSIVEAVRKLYKSAASQRQAVLFCARHSD